MTGVRGETSEWPASPWAGGITGGGVEVERHVGHRRTREEIYTKKVGSQTDSPEIPYRGGKGGRGIRITGLPHLPEVV